MSKSIACVLMTLLMVVLPSCLKEGNTTILVNDPQEVPFITDFLPDDLLQMFGEDQVFFGDQPPRVDLEFASNHEYVATNLNPPFAPPVGTTSPVIHYHKIQQQYLQEAVYYSMSSEESVFHEISPVYLTGHDDSFTVYYYEYPSTLGAPKHAVLFSGILTPEGVRDFRYGYKIVSYQDSVPPTVYPEGTIFVFKDHDGLADTTSWFDQAAGSR